MFCIIFIKNDFLIRYILFTYIVKNAYGFSVSYEAEIHGWYLLAATAILIL